MVLHIFYKFIYLFIYYFWLHWVFFAVHRLSLVTVSGSYSWLWCVSFSLWWLLLLRSMGSRHTGLSSCGLRGLERRLSSCGARAYLLHGMWDHPGPGLEPVSSALAGGFLTTMPPGQSHLDILKRVFKSQNNPSEYLLFHFQFKNERIFKIDYKVLDL